MYSANADGQIEPISKLSWRGLLLNCRFEQFTELGERLRIKVVPSFYFYRDGKMVDHFATRDKQRIAEAINKHVGKDVADGQSIC